MVEKTHYTIEHLEGSESRFKWVVLKQKVIYSDDPANMWVGISSGRMVTVVGADPKVYFVQADPPEDAEWDEDPRKALRFPDEDSARHAAWRLEVFESEES